jgi:signal transduction histidine kinase
MAAHAQADSVYGRDVYTSCPYQTNCATSISTPGTTPGPSATPTSSPAPTTTPPPAPNTVATSPSGLQFAINLRDGQVISTSNYTVTVTPLNGRGASFTTVDFFIDGQLQLSTPPDPTGTATWQWNTVTHPGSLVRVVVYDGSGTPTAHEFTIKILITPPVSITPTSPIPPTSPGAFELIPSAITHTIKQIPVPIARSFPYLLFVLMGASLLILVWRTRDEVARAAAAKQALKRELLIAEEKATFLQLAQHYLHTPLGLMRGAIDLQSLGAQGEAVTTPQLNIAVTSLGFTIDKIINQIETDASLSKIPPGDQIHPALRIWTAPGFWVPVGLLTLTAAGFDYLIIHVADISTSMLNLTIQAVIGVMLILALYQILRARQLRRRTLAESFRLTEHQQAVDHSRNEFIRNCSSLLAQHISQLKPLITQAGTSQIDKLLKDAISRYTQLVNDFTMVAKLESRENPLNLTAAPLSQLIEQAKNQVAPSAAAKHITITSTPAPSGLLQPTWLSPVLTSLLDNAIAYSPNGNGVEIRATSGSRPAITVSDHGAGIAPDKVSQLFQPFYKAEGALTFNHEGKGFNLFLDRLMMHYLGGNIEAASELGKGTTITLTLPSPSQNSAAQSA